MQSRNRFYRAHAAVTLALMLATGPALAAPDIQQWTTDNGARVLFVRAPEIPMVDARVTFDAGSARDGDHPGVARLTSNLLMSGTDDRDTDAVARAFERAGAEVSTGSARDMAWIKMRSLRAAEHLEPVSALVGDLLARPAFPDDEIARLVEQQRTGLREQEQSPGAIADQLFREAVHGDHPYGQNPLGTRQSLKAIDRATVQDFHDRYYVGANANVAIVGDIDIERAKTLAGTLVGDLPAGDSAPALPPVPELEDDRTIREPFPSTQSHVKIGRPGVARGYEQWPALYVANHVLGGGGFTSRLYDEVRSKRGLVYGVYSHFSPMAQTGPFQIQLQTRGDQVDEALGVVREVFNNFYARGPSAKEVEDAILNITGGFPLRIDSNSDITGYLAMMGFYGLPVDYLERFPERVRDVDADSAHAAFLDAVGQRPRVTVIVGGNRAREGGGAGDGAAAQ
ncbi:MAG: pitrilysin family protein [Halofilum sp. (in: g-proteobacteria)]